VARQFGVAAPDRTYLPPEEIPRIFTADPARLMAYARDDVLETLAISAILSPPYFVQAQALPFDYQTTVLRGNATKIDALLMREYLHRRQAIPAPGLGRAVAGGYTAIFQQGVARDVLHVDVTSLYPSLMLGQGLFPASDRLGVAASLLRDLREFRVSAKRLAREASAPEDRVFLNALQQTFKIFINSFYGYLAFSQGHWNDFEVANRVTGEGRRLVQALLDRLGGLGATVVEVDTDGIYFVPPASPVATAAAAEEGLVAALAAALPEGIQLELDGRYAAMFSYKMKNYVLLDARGKLLIKGSGLRSRGIELFQRLWMEQMFRLLLTGRRDEIPALVARWEEDFRAHRVPLRQFMKTETLQESLAAYRQKLAAGARNVGAAYELAQASPRSYQPGDQVSYYVTGDSRRIKVNEAAKLAAEWAEAAPDENTAYYVAKLQELYEKFRPLIERDGLAPVTEDEPAPAPPEQPGLYDD
jgi:DNA polymerase elongation subunit (family B)